MLSSVFVWLDGHPGSYWILAGASSFLLFLQIWSALRSQPQDPANARRTGAWRDALVLFLFLLAWRWPFLLSADEYNPDESQFIAGAITLAHDFIFWRAVDGTTSGPLNFYILLPWHWLGMPLDYFTARLTGLLLVWGALFACHRTLADRFDRTIAWAGILPAAGFFATVSYFDLVHYSSEHLPLFLIAVAVWLLAGRKPDDRLRLGAGCFIAGAAVWAKLQAAPLSVVLICWGLWQVVKDSPSPGKIRWKNFAGAVLAVIAPTLIAIAFAIASGQFATAYRRYFLDNLFYVGNTRPLGSAVRQMGKVAMVDGRVPLFLATTLFLVLGAILFAIIRRQRPSALFFASGILTFAAFAAVMAPRREFLHYVLLLSIPLSLWVGSSLGSCWPALPSPRRTLLAGLVLSVAGLPLTITRCWQPVPDTYGRFAYDWRHPRSGVAEIVHALAGKKGTLGIWGWACDIHVQTDLPQATRDAVTDWTFLSNAQRTYHRKDYLADLRRNQPSVFVDAVGPNAFAFQNRGIDAHENFPELAEYISTHYHLITDLGQARVYARQDLGTLNDQALKALVMKGRLTGQPNVIAPALTPLDHFQKKSIARRNVVMLLPPARMEWALADDAREVVFGFGFDPVAYVKGKSNGVELVLELIDREKTEPLYRRYLDPRQSAEDRSPRVAVVTLPAFSPGARLALRSDPGPYGDTAWDWVYLDNLQINRGPRLP